MMVIHSQVEIETPIEHAFSHLTDPEKSRRWPPELVQIELVNDYDLESPVVTHFRQWIRQYGQIKQYFGEITAFEKPTHFGVRIEDHEFIIKAEYLLESYGSRTLLHYTCEIHPVRSVGRFQLFVFGWLIRRAIRQQLKRFKLAAEEPAVV